jgi:Mn-dependent DtxR family transcriptional regulator
LLGQALINRHNVIENPLRILDISELDVLEETEKIEHTISNQTTQCFQDFVQFIKDNPKIVIKFKIYRKNLK